MQTCKCRAITKLNNSDNDTSLDCVRVAANLV